VVARLEEGELGANPRFIISSRYDDGFKLYYEQYCARGDMENRIKDQQLYLFADRTSSTQWSSLSDLRLIYCAGGKTAHISRLFRCIEPLCASKSRKPALAFPPCSRRLLKSDRLLERQLRTGASKPGQVISNHCGN
jgi:hypothetical protein